VSLSEFFLIIKFEGSVRIKMEKKELYSKWLLRPHNLEVRRAYKEYLREQVKLVSPFGIIIWGIITLFFLGVTLKKNEFKLL
jgi:hypothetical protein